MFRIPISLSRQCIRHYQPHQRVATRRTFDTNIPNVPGSSGFAMVGLFGIVSALVFGSADTFGQRKFREFFGPVCFERELGNTKSRADQTSAGFLPFATDDPLSNALQARLAPGKFKGGTLVLLAPPGSGKTSRAKVVCGQLQKAAAIRGSIYIDFNGCTAPPDEHFFNFFGMHHLLDNLDKFVVSNKVTDAPVVFILDHIDVCTGENSEKLTGLVQVLTKRSTNRKVYGQKFIVLVLCNQPDIAVKLLNINGGKKVQLLAHGKALNGGDSTCAEGTWERRGIRYDEVASAKLIDMFLNEKNCQVTLTIETRQKLVRIAAKHGTPAVVRDFFLDVEQETIERCLNYADQLAEEQATLWELCAAVSLKPTHP